MIVKIDDVITQFMNAGRELSAKRKNDYRNYRDGGWYKHYGITVHWRGAMMDKLEFESEEDYMLFLLKWS